MLLDVVAPSGETLAIDDPKIIEMLGAEIGEKNQLTLIRSDRALTDCRPISLISLQTVRQIEAETGVSLDKRRFRANIYFNFAANDEGFAEDSLVGPFSRTNKLIARNCSKPSENMTSGLTVEHFLSRRASRKSSARIKLSAFCCAPTTTSLSFPGAFHSTN